jgi:branched-chain amino acid transport system permease protein
MILAQILINGILLGGLYACMAIGFSLVWGVLNLINLAHGSMIILGAYVTYYAHATMGIDPFLTIPVAGAVLFALGFLLQKHLLNLVVGVSVFLTLVLTFGLDMVLINLNIAVFSADVRSITTPYSGMGLELGEIKVPYTRLAVFAIALALTGALSVLLNRSRPGRAIRATAQNPLAAQALGVDTPRVYALTFGLGACMAGMAGSLLAVVSAFSPVVGATLTMKSFVVVLLGGLGNIPGTIVAGILLGVVENLVSGFWDPGYRDVISFALLVLLLVLRPHGALGKRQEA